MTPLLIIPTDGRPRALAVDRPTRLGRKDDCALRLESHDVSRHHARITWDGARAWVEDLGSRNGTFVNGRRISEPTALNDRDELRLANVTLRFRLVEHVPRGDEPRHGTGAERGLIVFHCPNCAHRIGADPAMANFVRTCPACQQRLIVSAPPPDAGAAAERGMAPEAKAKKEVKKEEAAADEGHAAPPRVPPKEAARYAATGAVAPSHGHVATPPGHHEQVSTEGARVEPCPDAIGVVTESADPIQCEPAAAAAPPESAPRVEVASAPRPAAPRSTQGPPTPHPADSVVPRDAEAPAVAVEPVRDETFAADLAHRDGASVQSAQQDAAEQRIDIDRPGAPHEPRGLEPTWRTPWAPPSFPASAPMPARTSFPVAQADHHAEPPWVEAVQRPGIRMDHHPSAAPLCAVTHPPAANSVAEASHVDERDWFATPINQPWRPVIDGGKGPSAARGG